MYAYAANNPVKYTDPDGREAEDELAKSLRDTTKTKGVDLNLFSISRLEDIVDKKSDGSSIRMRDIANNANRYKSMYYIAAHGNRGIVSSWGKDGNNEKTFLYPKDLAKIIKSDEQYHSQPIVLWICNLGNDPENNEYNWNCYAKELQKEMGTDSILVASQGYVDFKTGLYESIRPNGRTTAYRTFSVKTGKQYIFRGSTK